MIPNVTMISPETRLIHIMRFWFSRSRINPTPKLSASHQVADPANTPATSTMGELVLPRNMVPAKIAANERMVIGLVMVRKKVEMNVLKYPL